MDVYLVGGAVRDALLGRPVKERDWVVVGSTPEEMRRLGYRQVGRDFPVFLHPETAEEYALARTERKSGPGHTGFVCHAGPDVTLEDDLRRRDLTVNAIAQDAEGRLVDPFGGQKDLERRVLRHVSPAFVEDPLRVFRVARFAARLPGFSVAPETLALMTRMAGAGALDELSPERVWQELLKALQSPAPARFFEVLAEAGALEPWLSELADGWHVPPGLETPEQRFAALAWRRDPAAVAALCARLKAPNRYRDLARHVAEHGPVLAEWRDQPPEVVLEALTAIGAAAAQRDPQPALTVVAACAGRDLGDLGRLVRDLGGIGSEPFRRQGLAGAALGSAIRDARLQRVRDARQGR